MVELSFKQPATLRHYANQTAAWNNDGWLYIRNAEQVTLDITCYLQAWNGKDLSLDEQDAIDNQIIESGFKSFLLWSQLNGIERNLYQQKPGYTDEDLELAVQYYWTNDAFIVIS